MADEPRDLGLQARSTIQPTVAHLRLTTEALELDDVEWEELGIDLYQVWIAATSARADFDENLRAFEALYQMAVEEQDSPWLASANLTLPIIPSEIDAILAYLVAQVFPQRTVIVSAADGDPETARLAPQVEKFYNAELRRIRADGKTPIEHFKTSMHLGLRDGGGPVTVLFSERKEPRIEITDEPIVSADGESVETDDATGLPKTKRQTTIIEETIREVIIENSLLKEWYLIADESTSINTALGQATVLWMTEKQMREKIKSERNPDGYFKKEAVEEILIWNPQGTSDTAKDPQGSYDKDAGGQINIGQGQGSLVSKFFRNRGPFMIIRLFSEQFDMNGDDDPEKNVFYFYPFMPKMVGWHSFDYAAGGWPTFMFAPLPRPDRPYGFSFAERLADMTAEASAGRNQRRNYIDMTLLPLLLQREGDTVRDKDRAFAPGERWDVEDVDRSLKWFTPNHLDPNAFADEANLVTWISKLTGQNAPALGAQSSGRRSATESRQQQLAQSMRANLMAMDFRFFLRAVMQYWHKLNKQFLGAAKTGPSTMVSSELAKEYGDVGGEFTLPPEVLARNYNIDIAGLSDPVDAPSRRQEMLAALGIIAKVFPWILADPEYAYALAETLFETFQWAGIERFIGTPQDAKKRKEDMQKAAEQQQLMAPLAGAMQNGKSGGQ